MSKFIDKIAEYIFEQDLSLTHLTIVLPSQRAKKYLQKALFNVYKKPIFSPRILTMNHWISDLTDYSIIDSTRALFKLYDIHLKVDKEEPQSIDEFLKWGRILLSDFDEIDRYLINSKDLFKNLADIKDIENWSFGEPDDLTEGQKRYMRFWDLLEQYYSEFNKLLKTKNEAYMGMCYKQVATDIDLCFKEDKDSFFIFAGFNALSPAEIAIMKQLNRMGRAEIFVDADKYYLNNKNHEAGRFIRDLFSELNVKELPFITDKLSHNTKQINIINCPQPTGQAKVSATILNKKIPANEFPDTLLLLADESLVVPVIKNIPRNVEKANITLGLPLKNTAVKSWVDLMFSIQENYLRFNTAQIYHKDFIRFIKHPFIIGFCNVDEQKAINKIEQHILNNNWTFIYPKKLELGERISEIVSLFFTPWTLQQGVFPMETIKKLNEIIFEGLKKEDGNKNEIERFIIYNFNESLTKLSEILEEFKPKISLGTFKTLFNQHWINETIAYYGNPLNGLQVMGLLETRLIDFKNMIAVGLNDGSMPPTNPIQSMIMMDLRRFHNLPTPREKQGLFAHHFYRLLHTSENIWITYSSANREQGGMDEPSRYIMQLQLELSRINPKVDIKTLDYVISNEEESSQVLVIEKTPSVLDRLDEYFSHKTSASALKTAMRCPLDFYYKYLLGLGEEDKVEEEIEASTFGNFIHHTLHVLYQDYAKYDKEGVEKEHHKSVHTVDVELMRTKQKEIMSQQFKQFFDYSEQQNLEGKNYLSLEIAQHLTDRFLKKEEDLLKQDDTHFFITALELELEKTLKLNILGKDKTLRFVGIIDRIDDVNGEKRIIDYKSGRCNASDVTLSTRLKDPDEDQLIEILLSKLKSSNYIFQMLIYLMLYHEKFNSYPDKVGIISMVNLNDSPFYLDNQLTSSTEELMELFEKALVKIVEELYDTSTSFTHDSKSVFCGYC